MKKRKTLNKNPNAQARWHLSPKKSKAELWLWGASILIALLYGGWGVLLSREQVRIATEQSHTALQIERFNELLSKDSILVDNTNKEIESLTELNKTLSNEVNMNLQDHKESKS